MGKKSRLKKEKRAVQFLGEKKEEKSKENYFLIKFIFLFTLLTLFFPLVVNANFYFPFVGLKSLVFMAGVEIIFFAWLILILKNKKYRPKINSILLSFSIFLLVLAVSAILGVDFSRSFWSKYERMTGLLMWFHIFAFFLVTSSMFKTKDDWRKIFTVSIFVGLITSVISIAELIGIKGLTVSAKGGATLGNTSFLGAYLLFNIFLALWMLLENKKWGWKVFYSFSMVLMFLAVWLSSARAAAISIVGGFVLIFLLWLSFKPKNKKIRSLGRVLLVSLFLIGLIGLILLFLPDNFVHQKFIDLTSRARFVNWEMGWKAFLERPLLGWGPENYTLAFTKFFNPCLFIGECGGEIWFDRTHNIVFDTLSATGILGFFAYLGLFVSFFWFFWKKYAREKSIDFFTFSIFPTILVAYFIQNLTVFDMPVNLMMFALVLSFGASLEKKEKMPFGNSASKKRDFPVIILAILFIFSFSKFIIAPIRTEHFVIDSLKTNVSQEKINFYQKALEASPLGRYQIREFFGQQSQDMITGNMDVILENEGRKKQAESEISFLIAQLQKTKEQSPQDFRSILRLANLYNLFSLLKFENISLAEQFSKEAIELSPDNQQGYWALAQTRIYQQDFEEALKLSEKAIELEPKLFQSYKISYQIAKISGDLKKAKEITERAGEINSEWIKEFDILE